MLCTVYNKSLSKKTKICTQRHRPKNRKTDGQTDRRQYHANQWECQLDACW